MEPPDEAELPEPLRAAVTRVRDNRTDGASSLARTVAAALADAASPDDAGDYRSRLRDIHGAARAFAAARPSMAAVANAAARIWHAGASDASADPGARLAAIHSHALAVVHEFDTSAGAIFEQAHPSLSSTLYTLSRSGTVESVLTRLAQRRSAQHETLRIVVSESRPGGEGIAAARALAAADWQVTLVPDTAAGLFLPEASAVVIGADSVRADGSVVNKVGSYPLALMARAVGVPVYVLCEQIKIAAPDFPLHFEEMDPRGLLPDPPPGVIPRNVYFDQTPADLVTAVVTERGPLSHDDILRIAKEARQALTSLAAVDAG